MKLACSVAALLCLSAAFTIIHADPADDARAEKERAAKQAAEDKKRAAEDARRAEEARKNGENAMPVMVNNRFINPVTGKELGTFKGGSTYLPAMPGALDNWYWVTDAGDNKITVLVDVHTQKAADPGESPFTVDGKKLKRTVGAYLGDPSDEGEHGERGATWECELPGRILTGKSPWYADGQTKLYVAYEGGVACIDNLHGNIIWTSPGASGSLYPGYGVLLSVGESAGVTKLSARTYEKGDIAWSQDLGAAPDAEIMHVCEATLPGEREEQNVLAVRNAGASPATRWFTLEGKPLMSINEYAERVIYGYEGWTVLTPKRYAQIKRDGSAAWEIKRDTGSFDADAWIFRGEGVIRLRWGPISDSGVKVEFRNFGEEKTAWTHDCAGLEVDHSKYWHKVYGRVNEGRLVVVSQAAGGNFIEVLDLKDGKQIARHKP